MFYSYNIKTVILKTIYLNVRNYIDLRNYTYYWE